MSGGDDGGGEHVRWDIPPWELPGGFRLDAEPHRGPLLRRFANIGFICAVVSCYPCVAFVFICFLGSWVLGPAVILGLLGAAVGLPTWILARGDLKEMRKGLINPDGKGETRFGRDRAALSFILGLLSTLLWGAWMLNDYAVWRSFKGFWR